MYSARIGTLFISFSLFFEQSPAVIDDVLPTSHFTIWYSCVSHPSNLSATMKYWYFCDFEKCQGDLQPLHTAQVLTTKRTSLPVPACLPACAVVRKNYLQAFSAQQTVATSSKKTRANRSRICCCFTDEVL